MDYVHLLLVKPSIFRVLPCESIVAVVMNEHDESDLILFDDLGELRNLIIFILLQYLHDYLLTCIRQGVPL